jgi:hypothetical protein
MHDEIPETVPTCHTGTINLKESIYLTMDKDDTVKYEWDDPPESWSWQTESATFSRAHHHTHTHTHLVDVINHNTRDASYTDSHVYPVYLTGQVTSQLDGDSLWFTLTAATPTLKRLLFPDFLDSEMGHGYVLDEETRDPEHP